MAYSLLYAPPDYSSAQDDVILIVKDDTKPLDSSLYPDYKYVCDISINGTFQIRLKSYPRPNDKIGVFNIGSIIRNYINAFFAVEPNAIRCWKRTESFYVKVTCNFGEEFNFTTYPSIIVDTERVYFNHYNGRQFGTRTILTDYLDKALTTRPFSTSVNRNSKTYCIPFLPTDDSVITLQIRCFSKGLGLIRQVDVPISPTAQSTNEAQEFNVAPQNINSVYPGTIDDIIDYYTITFSTPNIVLDSVYRFDIYCESKYEVMPVHFMNKFGCFETKEFSKLSRKMINVNKSSSRDISYFISPFGSIEWFQPVTHTQHEQMPIYASEWSEKMVLNTDILSDSEYSWLKQLIVSPLTMVTIGDYHYQISILDSDYEERKIINDKLTNLTLNVEFTEMFNAQYR